MEQHKIIILSGGFAPIHFAHIRMMKAAKEMGAYVIVGVNSDNWLERKKGQPSFMSFEERCEIVSSMRYVDEVKGFNDEDNTACALIQDVYNKYKDSNITIYFGNGGDRLIGNTPELDLCINELDGKVKMLWELGGIKLQSSSDLLGNWIDGYLKKIN
jgi:cytidyltransferase-like protein